MNWLQKSPSSRVKHRSPASNIKGFTLIEVMVALVLLTVSLGAAMTAISSQSFQLLQLRDRFYANRVAMHLVSNYYLNNTWPKLGEKSHTLKLNEQQWPWRVKVLATSQKKLRRVELTVYPPNQPIQSAEAHQAKQIFFVSNPSLP